MRGARRVRLARRHHRGPYLEKYADDGPAPGARPSTPTGAGPAHAHPLRHRPRRAPRRRGHHGRRQRRPRRRSSRSPTSSSAASSSRPPRATCTAASRSAARSLKRLLSRLAGLIALLVRPGRHPRRHQLVQGLRPAVRRARSASSPTPASRSASSWWPRPAATASRSPRSPPSGSTGRTGAVELQAPAVDPGYLRWYRFAFGRVTLDVADLGPRRTCS